MIKSRVFRLMSGVICGAVLFRAGVQAQAAEKRPELKVYINGKLTEFEPPAKIEAGGGGYGAVFVPSGGFYKAVGRGSGAEGANYISLYDTVKTLDGVDMQWLWDENVVKITAAIPDVAPTEPKPAPKPESGGSVKVYIDGRLTEFSPPARIINGKVQVPYSPFLNAMHRETDQPNQTYHELRTLVDALRGEVAWGAETGSAFIATAEARGREQASKAIVYSDERKPVAGEQPGNILLDPADPDTKSGIKFTESYMYGLTGECAWYAAGRFTEVHGLDVNIRDLGYPKDWLNGAEKFADLQVIKNTAEIKSKSIGVFKSAQGASFPGHVVFIEYVERDSSGSPAYVYFTESNGGNTLNKGKFDPGYDGIVQKIAFTDFKNKSGGLIGYIAPQE